jgi:hypothetical protein
MSGGILCPAAHGGKPAFVGFGGLLAYRRSVVGCASAMARFSGTPERPGHRTGPVRRAAISTNRDLKKIYKRFKRARCKENMLKISYLKRVF